MDYPGSALTRNRKKTRGRYLSNAEETIALIERYRSITLEDIRKTRTGIMSDAARKLTGFGSILTCTLCVAAKRRCRYCVHYYWHGFAPCREHETFKAICRAQSPEQLVMAFRERAKYLEGLIQTKQY